ncbi:MAG: carbohydrate-binding module family 20 domain-containing protein, partial [Limisphaerales bacterium]
MRLTFQVRFYTHPGQSLWLTGEHELFGGGAPARALPMSYLNNEFWRTTLVLPDGAVPDADLPYRYILREPDGTTVEDWGRGRWVNPAQFDVEEVLVIDSWNSPAFYENAFYTEPFKDVLLRENRTEVQTGRAPAATHTFRVKTPLLPKGQTVCLLGNNAGLAQWNTESPILLGRGEDDDYFTAELNLNGAA